MCGKGKTSWAIQYMKEHPEKSFIYVTPLLNEVSRIKENTNNGFVEPIVKGKRKFDDFNTLLCNGNNIVTTHATFANSNATTISLLRQGGYTLFLDEVIDVIIPYNDLAEGKAKIKPGDIKLLLEKELITVDSYGRVSWIGPSYDKDGYTYAEIERLAKMNNLLLIRNTLFLWEFPVDVFKSFGEIFILTYMFQGSQLCPYLEYYNLRFEKMNVIKNDDRYEIIPYQKDDADKDLYMKLIEFNREWNLKEYDRRGALSSYWYKNNVQGSRSKEAVRLRNNLKNFFKNKHKAKASQIMWTCPKDFRDMIKGNGFKCIRQLTSEEEKLPEVEKRKLRAKLSCFVSCNARATNDFRDRTVLAYCCNLFVHPNIVDFFKRKNIAFDEDAFTLSNFIQWVWRSAIRDGKPIKLYVPSLRIRTLFGDWLCG